MHFDLVSLRASYYAIECEKPKISTEVPNWRCTALWRVLVAHSGSARITLGGMAVVALLTLTACATGADAEPAPTTVPGSPSPKPYAGPALFAGNELNEFLFSAAEISSLLPGSAGISEPSAVLEQTSDGDGPSAVPDICGVPFIEQSLGSIGSRNVRWAMADSTQADFGQMLALQFADEAHAQARMDQVIEAAAQCATFDLNGVATFESITPPTADDVRVVAGTLMLPEVEGGRSAFLAYAAIGNVLVQVSQPVDGDARPDPEAVTTKLQHHAAAAKMALIDELTANPPTDDDEPAIDESTPWSGWEISAGGVGPIRLGDPIADAVTAGQAAKVIEPARAGDPWKLLNADSTGSLRLTATDDGTAVSSITVGNDRIFDEDVQEGSVLPLRDGVRVGAPLADAVAAFPGGTTVTVASSGDDWYDVATRAGRLFRFHSDRDVVDPGAVIIGITVEDATNRPLTVR